MGQKRIKKGKLNLKSRTFVPKSFLQEVEKEAEINGVNKTDVYKYLGKHLKKRKKKDYRCGTKWFKV